MIVTKKCPKCKTTYDRGIKSRGIGTPFKVCSKCGTYILDKDENEWELKDIFEKIGFLFILFWTSFLYGLAGPLILQALVELELISIQNDSEYFLYSWGACSMLLLFWLSYKLFCDVKESSKRMKDKEYRITLRKLGIMNRL